MEPEEIYGEVQRERLRQDRKWGMEHDDRHNTYDWIAIIVGQLGKMVVFPNHGWKERFRRQMIRVAAVAFSALEWLDR